MLLLPITMAVMGVSVLTPVVHLLLEHFKGMPNHEYLVMGGVVTMPSIWVLLMSAPAGWAADRFGRRKVLILAMIVYAFVGVAPAFLDDLYAIIVSLVGAGICEAVVMTVTATVISDYFNGLGRGSPGRAGDGRVEWPQRRSGGRVHLLGCRAPAGPLVAFRGFCGGRGGVYL